MIAADLQQPPPIPDVPDKDYASKVKQFIDKKSLYEHPLHLRKHQLDRKADLFVQSIQWLQPSFNLDPTRTPHWSQKRPRPNDPDAIPMPVYNEIAGHIQNEASRLGKPEYKPYVRPAGKTPNVKTKEGARRATEILTASLEDMGWDDTAETFYHHMPMYGGGWLKSWWDTSMDKTVRVPIKGALQCPECDFKLASPDLAPEHAAAVDPARVTKDESIGEDGRPQVKHSTSVCLTCDTHTVMGPRLDATGQPAIDPTGAMTIEPQQAEGPSNLEPFTPVDEELQQQDHFGRPLGKDVPLGEWKVRNGSPYDTFPQDLGVDITIASMQEICEVHVESLDWIRSRFPDKADQIKAEQPSALLRWHPICGERTIFAESATGESLFRNHCRVKEYHKDPWMELDPKTGKRAMNQGRSIMMAGDVLLLDGPLMMESRLNPGKYVRRVRYEYAPWEIRSGGRELEGISMCEYLFDAQENINESKSQTADCRKRKASPKWLAARQMNFEYEEGGEAGSVWMYDPIPVEGLQGLMPKEIGSTTIDSGVGAEIEHDLEYMDRASGKAAVEDGNVPGGVSAAAAIQMLAEQTAERRRPRIRRIRKMFERIWRHGLELQHEFVVESREYLAKNDADEWTDRSWIGTDIAGQFDVKIDPEPEHDTVIQKQERVRDAITNLKIVDVSNPKVAMMVAQELDMPTELFEDQNLQEDGAERELIDFLEQGVAPVIDKDLDDPAAHYDRHGRDCHGDKWRALERTARWAEAWTYLYGWDEAKVPMPQPPAPMVPGQPPAPPAPPTMVSKFDIFEQMNGQSLPPLPELHIEACWKAILNKVAPQLRPRTPEQQQALAIVLRFRAHVAQHKRDEQAQATAGAPQVAAPDAQATSAGMAPTAGVPGMAA
jgi:hypothetical protein